jgi:hypothetical protein
MHSSASDARSAHAIAARAWIDEHCPADGKHQFFGAYGLVVKPGYAQDLAQHAADDGLTVE